MTQQRFTDKATGKPLVDLTEPIEFIVRPADIAAAAQADNHHCVVAQSLARRDNILSLTIGSQVVTLEHETHVVRVAYLEACDAERAAQNARPSRSDVDDRDHRIASAVEVTL